jgi:hypothetical protein
MDGVNLPILLLCVLTAVECAKTTKKLILASMNVIHAMMVITVPMNVKTDMILEKVRLLWIDVMLWLVVDTTKPQITAIILLLLKSMNVVGLKNGDCLMTVPGKDVNMLLGCLAGLMNIGYKILKIMTTFMLDGANM